MLLHSSANIPKTLFRGKGCNACNHSGFQGQIGLYELLHVSESIKKMILRMASATEIKEQAIKEGMTTMLQDGLQKAERGITTIEEIMRGVSE